MTTVYEIQINEDLSKIGMKRIEDDSLRLACLAKCFIEDEQFRVEMKEALEFITQEIGKETDLVEIKNLLDNLNIKLDGY